MHRLTRRRACITAGVVVQSLIVAAWAFGYIVRWAILAYSSGPAADAVMFTNWNFALTGAFFVLSLVTITCAPVADTCVHLSCFPVLVFTNAVTFLGAIVVVADNRALMLDGATPWWIVFTGERIVHVLVVAWAFVYTVIRRNDLAWIWRGTAHTLHRACTACGWVPFGALVIAQACIAAVPAFVYLSVVDYREVYGLHWIPPGELLTFALVGAVGWTGVGIFTCFVLFREPVGTLESGKQWQQRRGARKHRTTTNPK